MAMAMTMDTPDNDATPLIRDMWQDAEKQFQSATKGKFKEPLTFKAAVSRLDDVLAPADPKDSARQKRIKGVATNILNLVQLLGGIAAQGAGIVFGPADMCFNALHAMLDIPGKIEKLWDDVSQLLEETNSCLKQFKIYQRIEKIATLDAEFRQSVGQLLVSFVNMVTICVSFTDRRKRKIFGQVAKLVLLDDDSGVQDALTEFRAFSERHRNISDAVTLERIVQAQHENSGNFRMIWDKLNEESLKTQKGVDLLVQDLAERQSRKAKHEVVERICKTLGVPQISERKENSAVYPSSELLQGSGSWLEGLDTYKDWNKFSATSPRILVLSGDPGTGKSHLLSSVFHKLEDQRRSASAHQVRLSVVYHAFESDERALLTSEPSKLSTHNSTSNASSSSRVIQSFKEIAAQFATDDIFARNLDRQLATPAAAATWKDTKADKVFSTLFSEDTMPVHSNTFYILLLDGLDQLKDGQDSDLLQAIHQTSTTQLKFIVTSTREAMKSCSDTASGALVYDEIELEEQNTSDVKIYIEDELKSEKLFQADDANVQSVVERIRSSLPDIAHGNFQNAKVILDEVRSALDRIETEVSTILDLIDERTFRTTRGVRRVVRELETSLSAAEIQHLNELLVWTIYGKTFLSLDQMRAALFLLMNKSIFYDLKDKVENKLCKLLKIDNGLFMTRKPEIKDFFREQPRQIVESDIDTGSDEPRITLNISITNGKLSQVQRFLWDLSEKVVMNRFDFTKPIANNEAGAPISANPTDGNLTILRRCFDLLLEDVKDQTKPLSSYATSHVLAHIPSLETDDDKAKMTTSEKQMIAGRLVSLLQKPSCLNDHLTYDFFWGGDLLEKEPLLNVKALWSDPVATANFRNKERTWIKKTTEENAAFALYDIAEIVAGHWLRERKFWCGSGYEWLTKYLDLQEQMASEKVQGNESETIAGPVEQENEKSNSVTSEALSQVGLSIASSVSKTSHDSMSETREVKTDAVTDLEPKLTDEISKPEPDPILRLVNWVERQPWGLTKDALWHERLGWTYYETSCYSSDLSEAQAASMKASAKEHFQSAKELGDEAWQVYDGSASLFASDEQYALALSELNIAVNRLRAIENRGKEDTEALVGCLQTSTRWLNELKDRDQATLRLEEVISLTPDSLDGRFELIELWCENREEAKALELVVALSGQSKKDSSVTKLGQLLIDFCDRSEALEQFETVARLAHRNNRSDLIFDALESSQKSLQEDIHDGNESDAVITLRLFHGVALAYYDNRQDRTESALSHWKECIRTGFSSDDFWRNLRAYDASKCICDHYFIRSQTEKLDVDAWPDHLDEMKTLLQKGFQNTYFGSETRRLLAGRYTSLNQREEARKLLLPDIKCALGLLSDDDPDNDVQGFYMLAQALISAGEDADCLSAWSLQGPGERYYTSDHKAFHREQCYIRCDGRCAEHGKIPWSSSIWTCRVCNDLQLCPSCFKKLRGGSLKRRKCSPDHAWLLVPSWKSEFEVTGKDKVRVGGSLPAAQGPLQDGHRIGGDLVTTKEFLNLIREKWNIPRVEDLPAESKDLAQTAPLQRAQTFA